MNNTNPAANPTANDSTAEKLEAYEGGTIDRAKPYFCFYANPALCTTKQRMQRRAARAKWEAENKTAEPKAPKRKRQTKAEAVQMLAAAAEDYKAAQKIGTKHASHNEKTDAHAFARYAANIARRYDNGARVTIAELQDAADNFEKAQNIFENATARAEDAEADARRAGFEIGDAVTTKTEDGQTLRGYVASIGRGALGLRLRIVGRPEQIRNLDAGAGYDPAQVAHDTEPDSVEAAAQGLEEEAAHLRQCEQDARDAAARANHDRNGHERDRQSERAAYFASEAATLEKAAAREHDRAERLNNEDTPAPKGPQQMTEAEAAEALRAFYITPSDAAHFAELNASEAQATTGAEIGEIRAERAQLAADIIEANAAADRRAKYAKHDPEAEENERANREAQGGEAVQIISTEPTAPAFASPAEIGAEFDRRRARLAAEESSASADPCRVHFGRLTVLTYTNRALKIELTDEGREDLAAEIEHNETEGKRNTPNNPRPFCGEVLLMNLLEEHASNGAAEYLRPEEIGAMTDAPIIAEDADRSDAGDLINTGRVYWFREYETTDPAQVLAAEGVLYFTGEEHNAEAVENARIIEAFAACAVWQELTEDGAPLDRNFDAGDFSDEARRIIAAECAEFAAACRPLPAYNANGASKTPAEAAAQFGHDFALSRNGHGAGFFDRDELSEEDRDRLQEAARKFGEYSIYANGHALEFETCHRTPENAPEDPQGAETTETTPEATNDAPRGTTAPADPFAVCEEVPAEQLNAGDVILISSNGTQRRIIEVLPVQLGAHRFTTGKTQDDGTRGTRQQPTGTTAQRIKPAALRAVALTPAEIGKHLNALANLKEFALKGAADCLETRRELDEAADALRVLLQEISGGECGPFVIEYNAPNRAEDAPRLFFGSGGEFTTAPAFVITYRSREAAEARAEAVPHPCRVITRREAFGK